MQQKSVYLHTTKNVKQAEKILKNAGMEIVFRCDDTSMDLKELSTEERICWFEHIDEQFKRALKEFEQSGKLIESLKKGLQSFSNEIVEFTELFKNDPKSYKTSQKYEKFVKKVTRFHKPAIPIEIFKSTSRGMRNLELLAGKKISCSCILARKDNNLIRYLEFLENNDPILTISGPKATNLKTSLQRKF